MVAERLRFDGDKTNHHKCRRELVDAYRIKPTAREKDSTSVKRLLFEGDTK